MTDTQTSHAYVIAFHQEITRLLRSDIRHPLAEDVAQAECVNLLENIELVRDSYPNPGLYARVRVRHAGIDHDRRQAVQRGEGARLVTQADGTVTRARVVISGDIPDPVTGRSILETIPAEDTEPDEIVDRFDPRMQLLAAELAKLTPGVRRLLLAVKGGGRTVTDVAAEMGLDRSTASRLMNRALGDIYRAVENHTATGPAT